MAVIVEFKPVNSASRSHAWMVANHPDWAQSCFSPAFGTNGLHAWPIDKTAAPGNFTKQGVQPRSKFRSLTPEVTKLASLLT